MDIQETKKIITAVRDMTDGIQDLTDKILPIVPESWHTEVVRRLIRSSSELIEIRKFLLAEIINNKE